MNTYCGHVETLSPLKSSLSALLVHVTIHFKQQNKLIWGQISMFMLILHYYATSGFSLSCTAIGNAFAVLSDPEKRRRYDQFGDENPQPRIYRDHYDYARGFEGQWNILEISK